MSFDNKKNKNIDFRFNIIKSIYKLLSRNLLILNET